MEMVKSHEWTVKSLMFGANLVPKPFDSFGCSEHRE